MTGDACLLKQERPIRVIGVVVRVDHVADRHVVPLLNKLDDLFRLRGKGQGIDHDSPSRRDDYTSRNLGVQLAGEHVDIACYPFSKHNSWEWIDNLADTGRMLGLRIADT